MASQCRRQARDDAVVYSSEDLGPERNTLLLKFTERVESRQFVSREIINFSRSNTSLRDKSTGQSVISTDTEFQLYGCHETQESEGGEADLYKHLDGCQKNPGHAGFIPVKTFSIQHLPEDYHDHDLYEFIKATTDLTVRVDVKVTSPHRPEF